MEVESNSSVKVGKIGKCPCCICGKEVTILGRYQMADMNEICKECTKKTSPFFVPSQATIDDYKLHEKQLEDGKKLADAYFTDKKSCKKFGKKRFIFFFLPTIFINEEKSLILVQTKRGGNEYKCVFRLADIEKYSYGIPGKGVDGQATTKSIAVLSFHNIVGLGSVQVPCSIKSYKKFEKYLKKSMGLSGLKGMKNQFAAAKSQIATAKEMVNTVKGAAANSEDAEAVAEATEAFAQQREDMFYAGREELIKKADEAIKAVLG